MLLKHESERKPKGQCALKKLREERYVAACSSQEEKSLCQSLPLAGISFKTTSDMGLISLLNNIIIKQPHITSNMFIILTFLPGLGLNYGL